jgi:hypothetical protein
MFSSDNGQIMLVGFILIYEMDQLFIFTILCVIRNYLIYSHVNLFLQIQLGKMVHFFIFFFVFYSKYKNEDYTLLLWLDCNKLMYM